MIHQMIHHMTSPERATRLLCQAALGGLCISWLSPAAAEWELAFAVEDFSYEEPSLMKEEGTLYGGRVRWHSVNEQGFSLELQTTLLGGELDYDGYTWGGEPVQTDTDDVVWQGAVLAGYAFASRDLIAYSGLGGRYWRQELKGVGGYEREIEWLYVPLGLDWQGSFVNNRWSWSARAEGRWLITGEVTSHLSDVSRAFSDVENDVDDGYGYELSLSLRYRLEPSSVVEALVITPYYQYWDVDRSDLQPLRAWGVPVAEVYEPDNETEILGIRLGLSF